MPKVSLATVDVSSKIEEWRDVVGWEGYYQVSNVGRIKSLPRVVINTLGRKRVFPGKILRQSTVRGYLVVTLCGRGIEKSIGVHRLVLEAFIGQRPKGMQCRHFPDSDKTNNNASNLCWGTHYQNQQDKKVHGTTSKGEKNPKAKLCAVHVLQIRELFATGKYTKVKLGTMYGIKEEQVRQIVRRHSWKHI